MTIQEVTTNQRASRSRLIDLGLRLVLTVVALYALVLVFQFLRVRAEAQARSIPAPHIQDRAGLSGQSRADPRMWPRFPGSTPSRPHTMTIEGITVTTENWESTASAVEIVDYFRRQMTARGWLDVTEESFGIAPERRRLAGGDKSLQDPEYVELYRDTIESRLVMTRGDWSFRMDIEPGSVQWNRAARITGASTPRIEQFSEEVVAAMSGDGAGADSEGSVTASEQIGSSLFDTTITRDPREPAGAFAVRLTELQRDNWRAMFVSSGRGRGTSEHFALLERDGKHGYLIVSPLAEGTGASVLFTQVTEE